MREGKSKPIRPTTRLSRHASLLRKPPPPELNRWLRVKRQRSLSVPDLHKLRKEWATYQQSDGIMGEDTKLQVDLLNIRLYTQIKKPQMRLKMGPAQYYTKRASSPNGDWNEGFIFLISYHAQLFNTIEFDLYDKPYKHWPSSTKHVGKAKLKISTLNNKDDVFVTFLPIYEYQQQRLLPSDFQTTLLETNIVRPEVISKRIGDAALIGSAQIRVRYRFQQPLTKPDTKRKSCILKPVSSQQETIQNNRLSMPEITMTQPIDNKQIDHQQHDEVNHDLLHLTTVDSNSSHASRRSSYGRGDLAQDEKYVSGIFKDRLINIMSVHIPGSAEQSLRSTSSLRKKGSIRDLLRKNKLSKESMSSSSLNSSRSTRGFEWFHNLVSPSKKLPNSASGRRYGFSQNDSEDNHRFNPDGADDDSSISASKPVTDRLAHGAKKRAQHIIDSVNFGDRSFASQWMEDSFEDVALSHPIVDKLIGLVVSKQTQAMVRAIIKTANSFGQGFRVTGAKLFKSFLLVQKFYESIPKPVSTKAIHDIDLIDSACHYFAFALVAYGWRGLCYLGAYGQYVRGARDRRSNRLAIIRYLRLHPEDLLGYEYVIRKGASFQPSYYIARDRSHKAIVLSIRGTWSLYDAITDLVCEYMPWKGGLVHSGMLAAAQWFFTNIIPQIFRYIHHHGDIQKFIITGHSLGGGTASILTMMVADHIDELRVLANNPSFSVHCFNYAPAAVTSPDLGKKYEEYIHSFICQDDVVGRLSYGTAMKLKELVLDSISAYNTLGWRTVMTDNAAKKVFFDILNKRRDHLNNITDSTYPSLYIPGKIVHIRRRKEARFGSEKKRNETEIPETPPLDENKSRSRRDSTVEAMSKHIPGTSKTSYTLHYTTHTISNEMLLTKTCIEDHMIASYQNVFEVLREQHPSPYGSIH